MRLSIQLAAAATVACFACAPARADVFGTFNLSWSGASFGNSATATGQIVVDLTTIPNPGSELATSSLSPWIQSITVTVTGATAGNGTFSTANGDFWKDWWSTGGATLNLAADLVGQPVAGGTWGTPNGSYTYGDFDLFSHTTAPSGFNTFTLATNGGAGDQMLLTSFTPASSDPIPEPTTFALLGTGLILGGVARRRRSA